jgi:isoleucyl-tRNA synthetase
LASLQYEHPFCERTGRLFPADFVDDSTGTGFVHIAPGHGMDDYHLGLSVGLAIYCPVDDEGRLTPTADLPREQQLPESLVGKSTLAKAGKSEANEAVLALLTEKEALMRREDYSHSYPHCWRSKSPIIFRAVDQWFIRVDHTDGAPGTLPFRQQALAAIARGLLQQGVHQLVLAGGETSGACVQALSIEQLQIGPQIDPGVPWCHAHTPLGDVHITLKSGNFGTDDFFTKAFTFLSQ